MRGDAARVVPMLLLSAATASWAGDAENGKAVYMAHGCYSCHGYNGIGRRQLINGASGIMANEEVFVSYLRLRAEPEPRLPANTMPHYGESSLSDSDARDVYAYILTLSDEAPPLEEIESLMLILKNAEQEQENDAKP